MSDESKTYPTGQEIAETYRSPLVWKGDDVCAVAQTQIGSYEVYEGDDFQASWFRPFDRVSIPCRDMLHGKCKAQADYDRRISQILETLVRK